MVPRFTATAALPPFGAASTLTAGACNSIALYGCEETVLLNYDMCRALIESDLTCQLACARPNSAACEDCRAKALARCEAERSGELQQCQEQYGCPDGLRCVRDVARAAGDPQGTCCPDGLVGCGGNCLPVCERPRLFDPTTCTCACPPRICEVWQVVNPDTCACGCPTEPCPDYRMTRSPATFCQCRCPDGFDDCGGHCVDLRTHPLFCGSCGAEPCDPFEELCCDGRCTNICGEANCGGCGRALQPGEKCCRPACRPVQLGTDANCADCDDACRGGRHCDNGACRCPPGSRDCGNACCPNDHGCCGGRCVDTSVDPANCGTCGSVCQSPRVCIAGVCQCPFGQFPCGDRCCRGGAETCSNGHCCPAGTIWCGNSCVDPFNNPRHCGACDHACGVSGWVGPQPPPYDTANRCVGGTCQCPINFTPCAAPDGGCCPPHHPVCTGLVLPSGNFLCCEAGQLGARNFYTGAATCCTPGNTTVSNGVRYCT